MRVAFSDAELPFHLLWGPPDADGVVREKQFKKVEIDLYALQPGTNEPLMALQMQAGNKGALNGL